MADITTTPNDGNTWLSDASIDTEQFLNGLGEELTDHLGAFCERVECDYPEWDGGHDDGTMHCSETTITNYLEEREHTSELLCVTRDNVYNHDNDFSHVFNYSVYANAHNEDDWLYSDVYIAVCVHRGGDVRGNYESPRLFKVSNPADLGFFDWCLSWTINGDIDSSEQYQRGYSSAPMYEVEKDYGNDGVWVNGRFYFHDSDSKRTGDYAEPSAFLNNC